MPASNTHPRPTLVLILIAVGVLYGILTAEYGVSLLVGGNPWWDELMAMLTNSEFALGPGSVSHDQAAWYATNRIVMAAHMITSAVALLIAPLQFIDAVRQRSPLTHRWLGRVGLLFGSVAVLTSVLYLAQTTSQTIYSGTLFMFDLWGLAITYGSTGILAYLAIRARKVESHRTWMALHVGLLMAAPVLRILWLVGGNISDWSQAQMTTLQGPMTLAICVYIPVVWLFKRPGKQAFPGPSLSAQLGLGVAFVALAGVGCAALGDAPKPLPHTYLLCVGIAATVALLGQFGRVSYQRAEQPLASAECATHSACVMLSAPIGLLAALGLATFYPVEIAVTGGATVGLVGAALAGYGAAMHLRGIL